MKAITYHGIGDVRHDSAPDPAIIEDGDAVIAVEQAAICGSDLHVYFGREVGLDPGTVLGHEFTGRVVAAGPGVRSLVVGDRVMSPFTTSCGACFYCDLGLSARCVRGALFGWVERGRGLQGGQAEFVRVPLAETTLLRVPEDLSTEQALALGDVLATGWHCARMADVGPGAVCAVVGCGSVGLMAALAARELGAERVFALDSVPERLERAQALGAEPIAMTGSDARRPYGGVESALDTVRAATAGRGADAVLEAVGSSDAASFAFDLVRPGGTIATVGVHHEAHLAFSPGQAYDKNLTWRIGRCPARSLMSTLVPVARKHGEAIASLFTHRLPLAAGGEAYSLFADRRDHCVKVALTP